MARSSKIARTSPLVAATTAVLASVFGTAAGAAVLSWDNSTAAGITDGSGSWSPSATTFTTDGGATNVAWSNTTNAADTAEFGDSGTGTGGTVTLDAGGITAGGISVTHGNGYTFAGGPLTLGAASTTVTLTNSAGLYPGLTFSSPITGTNGLVLQTTSAAAYAYVSLNAADTNSGGVTIAGNALQLALGNNAALGTGSLTVNSGVTFANLNTSSAVTAVSNAMVLTGGLTINNSGTATAFSGAVSGAGALTVNAGSGKVVTLSGARTNTGGITAGSGQVIISGTRSTSENLAVSANAVLDLATPSTAYTGTITVHGSATTPTELLLGSGKTFYSNGGFISVDTAPTIVDSDGAGNATIVPLNVGPGFNTVATAAASSGTVLSSKVNFTTGTYGITFTPTTGSATAAGDLVVNGVITGANGVNNVSDEQPFYAAVIKRGTGSLDLTGASTFGTSAAPRGVAITAGSVILGGGNNRLPVTAPVQLGAAGTAGTAGSLVLNGVNQTITGLYTTGTATAASNTLLGGSATGSILTVNFTDTTGQFAAASTVTSTDTFGGTIGGAGANANNLAMVKTGTGTLALTAANTYAGGTTVSAGTLIAGADSALGTGNVSVASGATLNDTGGTLNNYVADTATLALVTGSIDFLNYTGTDFVAALTLDGVSQPSGVYSALNDPTFFTGTGSITVAAVPEPATISLLGLASLAAVRRRRSTVR